MRILSFSHDGNLFGAQKSQLGLLSGLQKNGHTVQLVIPDAGDMFDFASSLHINTIQVHYPYPSLKPHKAPRFLAQLGTSRKPILSVVEDFQPDIVHFNTAACVAPAIVLAQHSCKKVWHLRERAPARGILSRIIKRYSHRVIANCWDTALGYDLLVNKGKLTVVHNGLELEQPSPKEIDIARNKMTTGDPVILFAGHMLPHKNPAALINIARILKEKAVDFKMVLFGSGPEKVKIEDMITRFGLSSSISLHGFEKDIIQFIAACDIVVIPSKVEPFPRIGLEAMALGKPIVGTNVGGMTEQVEDRITGFLLNRNDYPAMADACANLLNDRDMRLEVGKNAEQRYRKNFTNEIYTRSCESIFADLLDSSS